VNSINPGFPYAARVPVVVLAIVNVEPPKTLSLRKTLTDPTPVIPSPRAEFVNGFLVVHSNRQATSDNPAHGLYEFRLVTSMHGARDDRPRLFVLQSPAKRV
jgi:hypothetical protein